MHGSLVIDSDSFENVCCKSYVQQITIVKSVFVDDLLVTGNDLVQIENVSFALTDEGNLSIISEVNWNTKPEIRTL